MVQECQHTGDFFSPNDIATADQLAARGGAAPESYTCGNGSNAVTQQQGFVAGSQGCGSGGTDCTGAEHTAETRAAVLAMLKQAGVELNADGTVRCTAKPAASAAHPKGRVHAENPNLARLAP